jgi:hypothetical protein
MRTGMLRHIDEFDCLLCKPLRTLKDFLGLPAVGKDGPVVILVRVDLEQSEYSTLH